MARIGAGKVPDGGRFENVVPVGHGNGQGWLVTAEIGAEFLDDDLLNLREISLEEAWNHAKSVSNLFAGSTMFQRRI